MHKGKHSVCSENLPEKPEMTLDRTGSKPVLR